MHGIHFNSYTVAVQCPIFLQKVKQITWTSSIKHLNHILGTDCKDTSDILAKIVIFLLRLLFSLTLWSFTCYIKE